MDAQRANMISKAVREVMLAAKAGGGNPDTNVRLRMAIEKAKSYNVSADNIERAIKRGTGELDSGHVEEITYEGYGPGGTAVLVEVATDNRNRTASEIRHLFSKHGGKLAELGSVAWMFDPRGFIALDKEGLTEEEALEMCIEAGALDMQVEDDCYEVYTEVADLEQVRAKLESAGARIQTAELTKVPKTYVNLGRDDAEKLLALLDVLESHDDVSKVYANFDVPDELLSAET
jgi:YebC/PmpR family DNA-binding regulatory protein